VYLFMGLKSHEKRQSLVSTEEIGTNANITIQI
jgi:hypothetical protein